MKTFVDSRVENFLERLNPVEKARLQRYRTLLEKHGFSLPEPYLKKLDKDIWELRPGNVRILFAGEKDKVIFAHAFYKKTQKTPTKELKVAKNRVAEYKEEGLL